MCSYPALEAYLLYLDFHSKWFHPRLYPLSRLRECCVYRATPREHTLLPCCLNVQGGADGITVIQAIGPFIKRQAVLIHLIAPGVWNHCHSSVDISSMRCLQAINVCFYKMCLYYSVLISVLLKTDPCSFRYP